MRKGTKTRRNREVEPTGWLVVMRSKVTGLAWFAFRIRRY
jgi:hypothetical protein